MNRPTYRAGTLTYTRGTLALLFFWLFWGDFCFTVMETVVPSVMTLKFKGLGAPNAVIALAMGTVPGLINTLANPVISFRSDRHRGRWGRRIPFIALTLPLLVASLVGLAFGDRLGFALRERFAHVLGGFSPAAAAVAVLGVVMALFSFFNVFVNSVFWYLYNDVVPEHMLARLMAWTRMVSLGASGLYSLFLLKHACDRSTEILLGAGVLYSVGLGSVCLKVKEGRYPPPPRSDEGSGVLAGIRTYGRECLTLRHYWYLFLATSGVSIAVASGIFNIFLYQSLGLSLEMIGRLSFAASLTATVCFPVCGWLADRHHPIRVVLWGLALQLVATPLFLVWILWHPAPQVVFYAMLALLAGVASPLAAMIGMMDPPLLMRIFPKERYGQFCSANAMVRSAATIASGVLLGVVLDLLTARWGSRTGYCGIYLWNLAAYAAAFWATLMLYRSWKRHGGDEGYAPPAPPPRQVASGTRPS